MRTRPAFRRTTFAPGLFVLLGSCAAALLPSRQACSAEPSLPSIDFTDPALLGANNRTGATLVSDLRRRGGGYVLPPNTAGVALAELSSSDNNALCPELRSLQAQSRALAEQLARLAWEGGPAESELELLRQERDRADQRAAQFSDYGVLRQQAEDLSLDDDARRSLKASAAEREAQHRAALVERDTFDEAIGERVVAWDLQVERVRSAHALIADMYSVYARLSGGVAKISYASNWQRSLALLRSDNPALWFEAIPTRNARVHAALVAGIGSDSYLAGLPAVLDYSVNGASVAVSGPSLDLPNYPESIDVAVTLSLVGSCVQQQPDAYDIERLASGAPIFAVSVSYEFPSASAEDVAVGYDLYRLYRVLAQLGAGAGRERSALLREAKAAAAVAFNWGASALAAAARERVELEVLGQLLERLSARMGSPVYDGDASREGIGPGAPVGVIAATPLGAALTSASGTSPRQSDLTGVGLAVPESALDSVASRAAEAERRVQALSNAGGSGASRPRLQRPSLMAGDPAESLPGTLAAVPASALQPTLSGPLSGARLRVVIDGSRLARRALDPSCGWFHLDCDGVVWRPRPGWTEQQLWLALEGWQTLSFARNDVTQRPAATLFIPGRPAGVLGAGAITGGGLPPPSEPTPPPPVLVPPAPPPVAPAPAPRPPRDPQPCPNTRRPRCLLP